MALRSLFAPIADGAWLGATVAASITCVLLVANGNRHRDAFSCCARSVGTPR
ncbi:hypothetical protein [Poseidonocella sp. HB161398]|uniref:hypothetical protein n=1 Tax=Poseidonocella sp. HB161398 TaxID=2320855 RepID=UPI0014861FE0|nr:hypothetical protein [Poseidonocella sp. HB161398]